MLINRKRETSFLLLIVFFSIFLITSPYTISYVFAETAKRANNSSYNPETIKLYQDCKAYLLDKNKIDHFCPVAIDIAISSYVSGQMFLVGMAGSIEDQRKIISNTKDYVFNVLGCNSQNEQVLIYPQNAKTDDAILKFLKAMEDHPDWLAWSPSQAIDKALLSFNCKKNN